VNDKVAAGQDRDVSVKSLPCLDQRLDPQAQALLLSLGTIGRDPSLEAGTPGDRDKMEKVETWLNTADLEGVQQAGTMAEVLRKALYPSGKQSRPG
jgi:hypothetical protein